MPTKGKKTEEKSKTSKSKPIEGVSKPKNLTKTSKSTEEKSKTSKPSGSKNLTKLQIGDFDIEQDDLLSIGDAEIDSKGLAYHHISSADDLYTNGIPQIITQVFKVAKDIANQRTSTDEDKMIDRVHVEIKFTDVVINRPTMINYFTGKEDIIYPNTALMNDKTYSANLNINADIKATAYMKNGTTKVRTDAIKNYKLCKVPVMVKSILCNTHKMSKEALMRINEDPTDPGGYFIIKGVEWVIDCIENILYNQIRIFKNEGYSKEVMRGEILSKPGDTYQNSAYFLVRLLNDNQLTCEILSKELKGMYIPFYLLFRALGWSTDKEMIDNIVYGYTDDISKDMLKYITESMNAKYSALTYGVHVHNQRDVMKLIVDELKHTEFAYLELDEKPDNYQRAYDKIFNILDCHFLAHVGLTPEDRPKKLRYLALMMRKMFLVKMGNMEPTDRDSYKSKRVAAAGESYAKIFKTYFNASIIQNIKRRLTRDFRAMSFSQVDLAASVKSSVYAADFERSIMQAITSGNKSQIMVNKKAKTNRLSSQLVGRKNQIAVYATLRQVSTTSADSSKQSGRANEMRRVHMSFLGYIDLMHSSTGEKVGINKQLAIYAGILKATSSQIMRDKLLQDKDVIPLEKTNAESIFKENLRNVYVNGKWIGCSKDCLALAIKYRKLRRAFEIHPLTTIHWENTQDEVYFWVDVGRVVRPLIIVYNNKRDPEKFSVKYNKPKGNFMQGTALTKKMVSQLKRGEIGIEYLLRNNVVEYITADEQDNCYLCSRFDILRENKNDEMNEYTHCDIPQAILGLTSLTGPYANHNQLPRITFQTSQCQQTCGIFALNWPYRCDKDAFLQYVCETPLIKTIATKYAFPNGSNVIVAVMCYSGYNQEDSLVINEGAVERGLFNGSKFTFYKTELEQREEFGNPDMATTSDIKAGSYAKLEKGIIKRGTKINKGDAVIGKQMRISKTATKEITVSDRSIIYKQSEEAIVHNVTVGRNEDDERFCKVGLRKVRPVKTGDKFSSRAGQKGVVGIVLRDSDMPCTKDGIKPGLIINPHAFPSRMTIGQLYEKQVGNWCAKKGTHTDGTIFKKVDTEAIGDELEAMGMDRYGYHRLYSGITGEHIDVMIFMGPTYYQRLQKFVIDTVYSISHGPSDAMTRQPLDGKASNGGIRIGEMERDCLCSHGASKVLQEKFFDHSDGFTEYVCRCGKAAVVNTEKNLYKCKYCKDNADITAVPTGWSSKLFIQEMETMNVGVRRHLEPFTYEVEQKDGE